MCGRRLHTCEDCVTVVKQTSTATWTTCDRLFAGRQEGQAGAMRLGSGRGGTIGRGAACDAAKRDHICIYTHIHTYIILNLCVCIPCIIYISIHI